VSAFKDALKQLGIPICTGCGEMVLIERLNSLVWICTICSKTFKVEPKP
jgi:ribosomal protein L37AE/L43A